jgi:hypothetical protein
MSDDLKRAQSKADQNVNPNQNLKKKNVRLGFKKEEESTKIYTCSANESIFFKIVHNEEEFRNFQNLSNLENCFSPNFTNQIFNTEEVITGYKNLKILISLTPRRFFPHIKIIYERTSKIKDDIELLLGKHFEEIYEVDDGIFLKKLQDDNILYGKENFQPLGKLVYTTEHEKTTIDTENIYEVSKKNLHKPIN